MFAFDVDSDAEEDMPVSEIKIQKTIERIVENILSNGDIMCNVLDIKNYDDYIYYHSINVAMMSVLLGANYGMNEESLYQLTTAAILHDIGKRFLDMQHHENYDGTGYPLGKSGENIPLYARIIRLVEQYDDMVSLHRGRENLSPSDAMEYLMAGSGSLFDPKLVELFVEKIAVYPVGCEVELSNGMHGVVAKNFERFFLRPVVKVVETGEMLNLRDDPDTRSIIITKMVIH